MYIYTYCVHSTSSSSSRCLFLLVGGASLSHSSLVSGASDSPVSLAVFDKVCADSLLLKYCKKLSYFNESIAIRRDDLTHWLGWDNTIFLIKFNKCKPFDFPRYFVLWKTVHVRQMRTWMCISILYIIMYVYIAIYMHVDMC